MATSSSSSGGRKVVLNPALPSAWPNLKGRERMRERMRESDNEHENRSSGLEFLWLHHNNRGWEITTEDERENHKGRGQRWKREDERERIKEWVWEDEREREKIRENQHENREWEREAREDERERMRMPNPEAGTTHIPVCSNKDKAYIWSTVVAWLVASAYAAAGNPSNLGNAYLRQSVQWVYLRVECSYKLKKQVECSYELSVVTSWVKQVECSECSTSWV